MKKYILTLIVTLFATSMALAQGTKRFASRTSKMTKVTEVAETPKESEATETQEVVEQSSEEAETTYSSSYISIIMSYDMSKLKNTEDSDANLDMKGFSARQIFSFNISKNHERPIYLDWGWGFTYGRYKNDDNDYYKDYKFTFVSMNIPLGLSYRARLSENAFFVPSAGVNFRVGMTAKEEYTVEKTYSSGRTYDSTERLDYYDKDDMGDNKWGRFAMGYNIGANVEIGHFLVGLNFMSDFSEVTDNLKYQNLSMLNSTCKCN
ncbi:MAG: outer membrane beta-barrel protein [Rikenellaceae bacterium]